MRKLSVLFIAMLTIIVVGCSSEGEDGKGENDVSAENDFPTKPIEIVLPFSPGGSTDVFGRAIAKSAQENMAENFVVVNKPGGAMTLGLTSIFNAKPDGYEIALTTNSALDIQPHYGDTAYQYDDFEPIMKAYDIPAAIVVNQDSELESFDDWVEYCEANPGEFTYGVPGGAGSGGHIFMEKIAEELDIDIKHVPFEGNAELQTALLGGEIEGANRAVDEDKQFRPLLWSSDVKDEEYLDTPSPSEVGLESSVEFFSGFLAPKDTPEEVVQVLHDMFEEALDDPAVEDVMKNISVVKSYENQEDFAKSIEDSSKQNKEMMKEQGLIE